MAENTAIGELIVRYFEGQMTESELLSLEQWIYESEENKRSFFDLKHLYDSKRYTSYKDNRLFEKQWQKLDAKIKQKKRSIPFVQRHKGWIKYLKYAAIIVLAIGIGYGIGGYYSTELSFEPIVYNELTIEKGGKANSLLLSDGSKIVMNAATQLKYPTSFNQINREVFLSGEAYFEIAKNKEKPFVVKLHNQDITVLGTTFNIQSYKGDQYSVVTLVEGEILIESYNPEREKMSQIYLKPNQQAYVDNQTGSVFLSTVDTSISHSWKDGKYRFRDEKLLSIVKRLENYYGVSIILNGDSLINESYTGTFSLNQSIDEVLRIINIENKFTIDRNENEILLSAKK